HLKQRMIALSKEPARKPADKERQVIGWGSSGRIYADDLAERSRVNTVRSAGLLGAGRTKEAWQVIESAEHRRSGWPDFEWEDARIDVLDALGRGDEAQA